MVGVLLAIIRGYIDKDVINRAFTQKQINLPMAPGLGLVLDQVIYATCVNTYFIDLFVTC